MKMECQNSNHQVFYCLNAGCSNGETGLNAFDRALLASGCGNYNLLKISSILPARAIRTQTIDIMEGSLLPVAYACKIAGPDESIGETMSAAIAVAIPDTSDDVGVIMEYSGFCQESEAQNRVTIMAKTAMKDRKISKYRTICASVSCVSNSKEFNCAFAYVAVYQ